jgi:hypothetical protein
MVPIAGRHRRGPVQSRRRPPSPKARLARGAVDHVSGAETTAPSLSLLSTRRPPSQTEDDRTDPTSEDEQRARHIRNLPNCSPAAARRRSPRSDFGRLVMRAGPSSPRSANRQADQATTPRIKTVVVKIGIRDGSSYSAAGSLKSLDMSSPPSGRISDTPIQPTARANGIWDPTIRVTAPTRPPSIIRIDAARGKMLAR